MIDKKKNCNIPPLLENNVFISCFKEKARIFNEYFASQCSTLDNGSTLPFFHKKLSLNKIFFTDSWSVTYVNVSLMISPIQCFGKLIVLDKDIITHFYNRFQARKWLKKDHLKRWFVSISFWICIVLLLNTDYNYNSYK